MKITYDKHTPLTVVGLAPWPRLGLEPYFETSAIACLFNWDMPAGVGPSLIVASDKVRKQMTEQALSTAGLLQNSTFQAQLVRDAVPGKILGYRAVNVPQSLLAAGFSASVIDPSIAPELENKVQFRQKFALTDIPFPPFTIVTRADISATQGQLDALLDGRTAIVVQDEALSNGRGTFVVRSVADLAHALQVIEENHGGTRLVISDYLSEAHERSVQCVATQYGVFVGPLQKQIIGNELLTSSGNIHAGIFGGAEISPNDECIAQYPEIKQYAEQIGAEISKMGYRGIFSIDCLVTKDGEVFVLEINPRITGITPLLTTFNYDIPFYLLHVLEQAGIPYNIADYTVDPIVPDIAMLVVRARNDLPCVISEQLMSGRYRLTDMVLQERTYRITVETPGKELLLQQFRPKGSLLEPGGHLATVFVNGAVLDAQDKLKPGITKALQEIREHTILKEVK